MELFISSLNRSLTIALDLLTDKYLCVQSISLLFHAAQLLVELHSLLPQKRNDGSAGFVSSLVLV